MFSAASLFEVDFKGFTLVPLKPLCLLLQTLQKLRNLKMRKGRNFSTEGLLSMFSCQSMAGLVELDFSENTQFVDDCVMQMTKW